MNERINALRGKLPDGVLNQIAMYDCHPTADLMKGVKIETWDKCGHCAIPAGMKVTVQEPTYFTLNEEWFLETSRRELRFYFPKWRFGTCEGMIYIPDWAAEEYLEERLAAWLDQRE